jgi:hypothetical protein
MTVAFDHALVDYLALRRRLGHKLADAERVLDRFVVYLDFVGAEALPSDTAVAAFLIGDLRRRLERLEERLASYDRTRDYRLTHERTEADTNAWTDVVRSYVGDQFALTDD